jgi:hypothetical protein
MVYESWTHGTFSGSNERIEGMVNHHTARSLPQPGRRKSRIGAHVDRLRRHGIGFRRQASGPANTIAQTAARSLLPTNGTITKSA